MFTRRSAAALFVLLTGGWMLAVSGSLRAVAQAPQPAASPVSSSPSAHQAVLQKYCITCHNQRLQTAGLALDALDVEHPGAAPEVWERVITRLRAGSMPPTGRPRPDAATYDALSPAGSKAKSIAPGRRRRIRAASTPSTASTGPSTTTPSAICSRSTSTCKSLLPGDETADGSFDNFADVLTISTAHLERYLSVARQVTRLATGLPPAIPALDDLRDSAARRAGRSAERRPAVRIARRHRGSLQLPGRRRIPDQGPAAPPVSGLPDGHGLAAAARRPARWQAAEAVHRRRRRQGTARRGELCRRRRAGVRRRSRMGRIHAGRRRRRARGPRAGRGRTARRRRVVRPRAVGAGRAAAAAAARPRAHQRPALHGLRERRLGADRRPVQSGRTRPRTRRAAARCSSASRRLDAEERALRDEDPVAHRPARLSPAGDERRRRDAADVLRRRPARRRQLRRRHPVRARAGAGRSRLPAARASRSGRPRAGGQRQRRGLSHERHRDRLAAVVLPVEQHSRRAPDRSGRARRS